VSESIWHSCLEEPQGVGVGERIVVLAVPGGQYVMDVWTLTSRHGWLSATQGNGLSVCDCLRWAHERDVVEHVFGWSAMSNTSQTQNCPECTGRGPGYCPVCKQRRGRQSEDL
jgi:hypothetical protein